MRSYLFHVKHTVYNQGPEDVWSYMLVHARTLKHAISRLERNVRDVIEIRDLTIVFDGE